MSDFKSIQEKWQKKWADAKLFQAEIDSKKKKFFMTIPYPYISGSLHIGHARVVTEADVYTRYLRMAGYNVLYPIAFHISGTPVLGISLAIENGNAEKIALYKNYVRAYVSDEHEIEKIVMSFKDPWNIVKFFIPKMISEFSTLGLGVDWRRSFTSGDIEHQKMVEWMFRKYKEQDYLVQAKYPVLYSLTLKNAVGEDDIIDGDTDPVKKQEFTLLKFKFGVEYLVAATLRPETMFGQTNMWVNPDIEYVRVKVDDENWVVSKECAEKLKHQEKEVKITGKVLGSELLGKMCKAPVIERDIIILPSVHCDASVGTGLVTSVPSDAPFDWIALKELQDSAALCAKYKLDHEKIKAIKLIPIIKSKGFGEFPAVEICKAKKITSLSQHLELEEATQEIYKIGFHTGVMMKTCGAYAGMPVEKAKEEMKKNLISLKKADIFHETSRPAKSRDGGDIIVAVLDNQWFIDFNARGWKSKAHSCLKEMKIEPDKYRKMFEDVFEWLDKRPCARKRGLGTQLPFDKNWVIESLSDSTIYMTLYPIIHKMREFGITGEQMTKEFFDYVFNGSGELNALEKKLKVPKEHLHILHDDFDYWYPIDQRHTFTAHLPNHLSFMIFAHTACFDKAKWPKKVSFHGMVISEGQKMSKSKGNVVTLLDLNRDYGADAFRAFLCNSTSVDSTLNWKSEEVRVMKNHLDNLFNVLVEVNNNRSKADVDSKHAWFISKYNACVKRATEAIADMNLRDYSNVALFEIYSHYKKLQKTATPTELAAVNHHIFGDWVKLLAPLVPHYAEELWELGCNKGFVSVVHWPKYDMDKIDAVAEYKATLAEDLIGDVRKVLQLIKIESTSKITIIVSPKWKYQFFITFKQIVAQSRDMKAIMSSIMQTELKRYGQDITKMVPNLLKDPSKVPLIVLDQGTEHDAIISAKKLIETEFNCHLEVVDAENSKHPKAGNAAPGKPAIIVE